jgi:hypothetical protein
MADRSVTLTNTRVDLSGTPIPNQLISIALNLPAGMTTAPTDSISGDTIDTTTLTLRTNASGVWTQAVVAPGDIVPAGCTYTITEGTQETETPAFVYTGSPITVSVWYNTVSLVGRILMYVTAEQISTAPAAGKPVRITLNNTSIWSSGGGAGQLIYGNTPLPYSLNAAGTLSVALIPNASLTPSTGGCTLTTAQNFQIVFNVPSAYTGGAGVYAGGTTYAINAVVTDPTTGIPYKSLANSNTGNALSNATWWALYLGESITANSTAVSPPTSLPIAPTNILADASAATGTYAVPPITLQDQLRQLTQYPVTHVTSATYTALATDKIIDADGTGNAVAITLATSGTGLVAIKAINIAHAVTITNTIDGVAGPLTLALNECLVCYWDGAAWRFYAIYSASTGTVTSVGLTLPSWLTVAGSPITTSGTLAVTAGTQTANTALLGPTTGAAAAPTFRALAAADLPTLPDATPTVVGGMEIDQSPASGHPVALTTPRLGAANGVAALDGDRQLPSFALPTTGSGLAEAVRWTRAAGNPILSPSAAWETTAVFEPTVLYDADTWKMWYTGGWSTPAIGYATCPGTSDPTVAANWTKYGGNPVIATYAARGTVVKVGGLFYCYYADANPTANLKVRTSTDGITWGAATTVFASGLVSGITGWANTAVWVEQGNQWHMLVEGYTGSQWQIRASTSTDGLTWTTPGAALTTLQVGSGSYGGPWVPTPPIRNGLYHLWLHNSTSGTLPTDINHYTSPDLTTWTRVGSSPILTHTGTGFEIDQVADPCVLERNGTAYLWYDGDNNTSSAAHIGVATIAATLAAVVDGGASPLVDPTTAEGDLLYHAGGVLARLGIGANGQVLTSNGTDPAWAPATGGASHIGEPVLLNPGAAPDFVLLAGDVVVL